MQPSSMEQARSARRWCDGMVVLSHGEAMMIVSKGCGFVSRRARDNKRGSKEPELFKTNDARPHSPRPGVDRCGVAALLSGSMDGNGDDHVRPGPSPVCIIPIRGAGCPIGNLPHEQISIGTSKPALVDKD